VIFKHILQGKTPYDVARGGVKDLLQVTSC